MEVELLAPPGLTRRDLALALAGPRPVAVVWHVESEPSLVPGKPVFHNLTLGFEVRDVASEPGSWRARVTDDLTLRDDLDPRAPAPPGWWRLLSDDVRFLRIARRWVDPTASGPGALDALARMVGGEVAKVGDIWRLADAWGAPLVLATGAPGERERASELVSAPMSLERASAFWDEAVSLVVQLGFFVPAEGATHVHLDGAAFQDPRRLGRLAHLLAPAGESLRAWVGTNPRCRRLGPWAPEIREALLASDFSRMTWAEALPRLRGLPWTKYVDVNLRNLVIPQPGKCTVEFRIFPVDLAPGAVARQARLAAAIGELACSDLDLPPAGDLRALLDALALPAEDRRIWAAALPVGR